MIYEWDEHRSYSVDPQVAGETIEALQKKLKGRLTPQDLIEASKLKRAPLHNCFEWDDTKAAQQHRKWQAREIIRSIRVVVKQTKGKGPAKTVRAHIHVVENKGGESRPSYMSVQRVMNNDVLRDQVLTKALHEAQSWRRRYNELQELSQIHMAIEKTEKQLSRKIAV